MGKRGPQPAPTALKLVKGTREDRVNLEEPVPDAPEGDVLAPPGWLQPDAVEIWAEYAPELVKKGVLTPWDAEAFAALCDTAARRRRAAAALKDEGEVVQAPVFDRNGVQTGFRKTRNQWLIVLNQADRQLMSWAARFGLTPSDRSQLGGGGKPRDPYEDLLD